MQAEAHVGYLSTRWKGRIYIFQIQKVSYVITLSEEKYFVLTPGYETIELVMPIGTDTRCLKRIKRKNEYLV